MLSVCHVLSLLLDDAGSICTCSMMMETECPLRNPHSCKYWESTRQLHLLPQSWKERNSLHIIPVSALYQDVSPQVEEVDRCTAVRHAGRWPAGL
jgi:hypothetical protein